MLCFCALFTCASYSHFTNKVAIYLSSWAIFVTFTFIITVLKLCNAYKALYKIFRLKCSCASISFAYFNFLNITEFLRASKQLQVAFNCLCLTQAFIVFSCRLYFCRELNAFLTFLRFLFVM